MTWLQPQLSGSDDAVYGLYGEDMKKGLGWCLRLTVIRVGDFVLR